MGLNQIKHFRTSGIGLRMPHIADILDYHSSASSPLWLELIADNWLTDAGVSQHTLNMLVERFHIAIHGVGLSLGSIAPLNMGYLSSLKNLLQRSQAIVYSEHLSLSYVKGQQANYFIPDLLPIPFTQETLRHIAKRIEIVQDFLGYQMLVENISAYISYPNSDMSEAEFLSELVKLTGCGLLLDVNNLYVNQVNLAVSIKQYIENLPLNAVQEIHLAGYENKKSYLIDAHNNPVSNEVWELYEYVLEKTGPVATLIEWDNDLPPFDVLLHEQQKAQSYLDKVVRMSA